MPISEWDGYTLFVIISTIIVSTFFMGLATKRIYRESLKIDVEIYGQKCRLNGIERLFLLLSFATVISVVGLQMSNSDYEVYSYLYKYEYSLSYDLLSVEGIFRAINKLVHDYLHEFQFVIFITNFITNCFMFNNVIYYSLRSKVNPKYVLFIYLSMYMLVSFGMLRQICAVSIVIYSFRYFPKKQYFKYVFFILLALGFHVTAIISIPLLVFVATNVRSKDIKLLYRIIIVIAFYFASILSNEILSAIGVLLGRTGYSDYYAVESIGLGNLVYRIPILVFLCIFRKTIKNSPMYVRMFSDLVLFEVLLCFTYYFIPMLGGRMQYFILFGYAIVVPYCINEMNKKSASKFVTGLIVYGYGLYYIINQLLTTGWITKYLMPIKFFGF